MTAMINRNSSPITTRLCDYIASALDRPLPEEVALKARHHILDTVASMLSGARLKPGMVAIAYVRGQGGTPEATLMGTSVLTSAVNAALGNGMMAHANETDDSHAPSRTHPGCAVVPAAWAMAERHNRSGADLLKAVVLGYDICSRMTRALGIHVVPRSHRSTHSIGGLWGAAAAAGALAGLDALKAHYLVSYTAQQTSGVSCWQRDEEHVEKAFDFGGMPARNGVAAASMVQNGFSGVFDCLTGPHNYFEATARDADPESLVDGLGERFDILQTTIKRWSVGSPIISALDALLALVGEEELHADQVDQVTVLIPEDGLKTVDNRAMPDVNLQHVLAVALADRTFSFKAAHDHARMSAPEVLAQRHKITLAADDVLSRARPPRQAIVRLQLRDGRCLSRHVRSARGTPDNPMTTAEITEKSEDLIVPVLGPDRARRLIGNILAIETVPAILALRPLLQPESKAGVAPC